ncbi:hypothetical protein ND991_11195 [Gordonia sputi]|uniref:hypothetical protein n=1 Tax=Gordonia sputi TaxID=36823 RepID=UPI002042F719|nr:hypothetical protein [Gordonia sputi]MCM3895775.1 hypothetical protein [Gordonia sputi]
MLTRSDTSDLTGDLLYMRKGDGFTANRIVNAGTLRFVLGGAGEPFDSLRSRFVSAIRSLRDPEPELLLAAYGLAPEYGGLPTIRERRQKYGGTVDRGIDTVADREDAAIDHLRVQLLSGWYTQSPLPARLPEMHNGIIQESVHIFTLVVDKIWKETREHYRFVALFDEAEYIAISSSYPGRPIPEGDFTVRTVRIGESFSHQFWHSPGPMQRGRTYDLRFALVPHAGYGEPGAVVEEARAFHERALVVTIEVKFQGVEPRRVWAFKDLTYFERPGPPSRASIEPTKDGTVRARLHDRHGGLFSGFAWAW